MIDYLVKLKDYVPLFQTLVWISFLIVLLLLFKKTILEIIEILIKRVKGGSSFKLGLVEVGEELKQMEYAKQEEIDSKQSFSSDIENREEYRTKIYEKNKGLFLTHLIYPSKQLNQKFDIYIYLIRHKLDNFSDIDCVEFFFGHMWGNRVFTKKVKNEVIGISTSAYAPFLCTCKVKFKGGEEIVLDRYIDFEIGKIYTEIK